MSASRLGPHIGLGFTVAVAIFLADQATKLLVLRGLELRLGDRLVLTPFLDLVLTYNRGISYGLFQQESESGRWLLVTLTLVAAVLFTFWMSRTHSRLVALALALLIGGAIGNALDRMVYGAVVDFVSLHAFGWRWYVFNLADTAIVAGVLGLLYDAITGSATKSPPSGRS
ncbi:MAG: signal peptidase II [Xanthobacteraceae bacterium]